MTTVPFTDSRALRQLQTALELSTLSDLNTRARALADRWVNAIDPGYPKDYVHATNVIIDPETKTISFGTYYVDGGTINSSPSSISTRYLEDSSTLESDAKVWKATEDKRHEAIRGRIEELKARPDVLEYLSLATHQSQRWAYSQEYGWHGEPLYPAHDLLKETPKP